MTEVPTAAPPPASLPSPTWWRRQSSTSAILRRVSIMRLVPLGDPHSASHILTSKLLCFYSTRSVPNFIGITTWKMLARYDLGGVIYCLALYVALYGLFASSDGKYIHCTGLSKQTSARLHELAPSSMVSSRNLADFFWVTLYTMQLQWGKLSCFTLLPIYYSKYIFHHS